MLINPAYAQAAAAGAQPSVFMQLVPLLLIFVVFYFLLIRPQQKKAKEHRTMLEALRRGDRIVTGGGMVGKITRVDGDEHLIVEIAEGVRVRVMRGTVMTVLSKGDPVPVGEGASKSRKKRAAEPEGDESEHDDAEDEAPPADKAAQLRDALDDDKK